MFDLAKSVDQATVLILTQIEPQNLLHECFISKDAASVKKGASQHVSGAVHFDSLFSERHHFLSMKRCTTLDFSRIQKQTSRVRSVLFQEKKKEQRPSFIL